MNERPGAWNIHSMTYEGERWTEPRRVESSAGRNDQRLSAAIDPNREMWIAYLSDDRWASGGRLIEHNQRPLGKVRVAPVAEAGAARPELIPAAPAQAAPPFRTTAWTDRRQSIAAGENRYQPYWGDIHRHTEISTDGGFDGTLY